MRKVIFICDKCKREIEADAIELQGGSLETKTEKWIQMAAVRLHFHPECLDDLLEELEKDKPEDPKVQPVKEPEEKEIAPVQKKKSEYGPKKQIDRGKVKALHEAGRTNKWIAEDMRCSEWSVSKILSELREMGEIE